MIIISGKTAIVVEVAQISAPEASKARPANKKRPFGAPVITIHSSVVYSWVNPDFNHSFSL